MEDIKKTLMETESSKNSDIKDSQVDNKIKDVSNSATDNSQTPVPKDQPTESYDASANLESIFRVVHRTPSGTFTI